MEGQIVSYTLSAHTTGLQDLAMFRSELQGLKELQGGFRADMGFGQQQRENIKATRVDLSGVEFQLLGLTDAIKVLDTTMNKVGQSGASAGQKVKAGFQSVDPTIADTVRSVRTLLTEFQSGNIKAGEFNAGMAKAKTTLTQLRTENSLGTRELQAVSAALNIVAKSYGAANSASSPYLVGLKAQRAAMNEVKATSAALNQEILGSRRAWQEGKIDSEQLAQAMTSYGIRANALLAPLEAQKAAILALGVPTKAQSLELERLTGLTNGYSLAAQRAAAGVDAARGIITRGSLAAGVQAGTASLSASLRQATADTTRLMDAERAGLITKEQMILGLADQTAAHRLALTAIETEMVALRGLGVLDVQQTERLAALATAQNGYTAALARTVAAQQAQAAAQRAAAGAALGVRGAGGMNNAAMAAMFISPELGMAAMAASMGPIVAGALAVGLLVKTLGDGVDKAAIFKRSLQQVGAISGESAEEMNHFGSYIQGLSTDIPVSTQRLAEMGREAVMVGLHGPEGMRVYTETMAAFSIITRDANGNLGHTAEVGQEVVKILRSTGATTSEVTTGFGQMINGLVGLKTESGVAIPQVTALLKFWSSQGHAVGLTINQMTGLSAALIQTGARAQGAGGAMAKFFDTAESAAAQGGAKLQAWANVIGLSAEKTKELLKNDPMEFLRRFVTGSEQLDHSGKALSLTLGSVNLNSAQVRRTMAELNNALPLVTGNIKIMNDASQDQGLAMRKAVEATDDYKDKVTLLSQGFDVLKTNMGMAVLPGMTSVLEWAIDLSKALNDAVTYQEKLKKALSNGTAAPGGDTYDLKTWLKNSGLNIGQLSNDQLGQAQKLLSQLQGVENARIQSQNLAEHSLLPTSPQMDAFYRKSIGEIGAKLGAIQQQVSGQVTTMGPLTETQQRLAGTPSRGFSKSKGEAIQAAAKELGVNPNDLAAIISFETSGTFDPTAVNKDYTDRNGVFHKGTGATGLIQFMPGTARGLGTTTSALAGMTFEQQMEYVVKYFRQRADFKPGASLGDLYSSVTGSGYKRGSDEYESNRVWDANNNGVIDRGEAVKAPQFRAHVANYFSGAESTSGAGDGEDVAPKALAAYVKEVARLQAAIDKAAKKGVPGQEEWRKASDALKAFTTENKDMVAQANEWISKQASLTKKALKDMGLSDSDWAKYKTRATELAGLQDKRAELSQPQALKLDRDVASFNSDPVKAKALQFASQQLGDQKALTAQNLQVEQQAAAESARISKALTAGKVADAQTALQHLKQIQSDELDNAGENQAKRLSVVKKTSQQIFDAEEVLARITRKAALAAAADEKDPTLSAALKTKANSDYTLALETARTARVNAMNAAEKAQTAAHEKAQEDQAKAAADTMKALREDDVKAAEASLTRLSALQDKALALDKDNVVKRVATARSYADQVYALQHEINLAQYNQAVRDANNGEKQRIPGRLATAQKNFEASETTAGNTRDASITQATDAQTSAIQKQRAAYSTLADSLRQHVEAGDLDSKTQQELTHQFNVLGAETEKLGLTNNDFVKGARTVTYGLIEQGHATYLTTQRNQGMISGNSEAAETALAVAESLTSVGERGPAIELLNGILSGLMDSAARGEAAAADIDKVRAALNGLTDDQATEAQAQAFLADLTGTIDEQLAAVQSKLEDPNTSAGLRKAISEMAQDLGSSVTLGATGEAAAEAIQTRLDEDLNPTLDSLEKRVKVIMADNRDPTTDSGLIQYLDAVIARGGEAGRVAKEFKDNLDNLVNTLAAPSLAAVLSNPEAYQDGAHGADGIANTGPGESVTKYLQGQVDQQFVEGLKKLSDGELTLAASQATATDRGEELVQILTEQKRRADEAVQSISKLAAIDLQGQTNTLEFQHGTGLVTDAQYIDKKQELQRQAAWQAWQDAQKAGGDMKVATAQLWADLLKADQDGIAARKTLAEMNRAADLTAANAHATNMLALKRSNAAADLTFQHSQGNVSDRGLIDGEQAQAEQVAMDKYLDAFNTAGSDMVLAWDTYQAEMTAASRKGVADRMALDKAGVDSLVSGLQSIGGVLGQLDGMAGLFGKTLTGIGTGVQMLQKMPDLMSKTNSAMKSGSVFDMAGAVGGWLGMASEAIGLISGIGDAIMNLSPAYQAWKKNLLDVAAAETTAMGSKTFGNIANPYYDALKKDSEALTTKANAGWLQQLAWGIFGGAPEILSKAASDSLIKSSTLFSDYAQSINSSLESELMNAFDNADFTGVQDSLDKMFGKLEASIALKALISKSNLGRDIQKLVDDTTAGLDTTASRAAVKADEASITSQFQAIAPSFAGYGASATSTTGTSSTSGTTTFGSVPQSVQLAISTPLMDMASLFDTASKRIDGASLRDEATAARNDATAARFEAAVGRISGSSSTPATLVLR